MLNLTFYFYDKIIIHNAELLTTELISDRHTCNMIWCRRKTCTMKFISIKIGNMIVPYFQWWIDVWMIEEKNNGWINCYHKYFSAFCTKWYLSANASPWCTSKCMIRTCKYSEFANVKFGTSISFHFHQLEFIQFNLEFHFVLILSLLLGMLIIEIGILYLMCTTEIYVDELNSNF